MSRMMAPNKAPTAWNGTFHQEACLSRRWIWALRAAEDVPGHSGGAPRGTCGTGGDYDYAIARKPVTPAEVHVIAAARQGRVKSFQQFPDVAADQHTCGVHREGVRAGIVLPLVHFVGVDQGEAFSQRLVESPTSTRCRLLSQPSCLQPATVTEGGARSTAWSSSASASGAGAASSCKSQIHCTESPCVSPSAGASSCRPARTAAPKPDLACWKEVTLFWPRPRGASPAMCRWNLYQCQWRHRPNASGPTMPPMSWADSCRRRGKPRRR